MRHINRIPIAVIAVFGLGGLVAIAVGVSLYLGLSSATENTRRLLQDQVDSIIDTEVTVRGQSKPVTVFTLRLEEKTAEEEASAGPRC